MGDKLRKKSDDRVDVLVLNHIQSLGLNSVEGYRQWCSQNGFSRRLKKNAGQRRTERLYLRNRPEESFAAKPAPVSSKLSAKQIVEGICFGQIHESQIQDKKHLFLYQAAKRLDAHDEPGTRESLFQLLNACEGRRARFLKQYRTIISNRRERGIGYFEALVKIAQHHRQWIRSPESWKVRTHNPRRQFLSLLSHLFAQYPVPTFLFNAWFQQNAEQAALDQELFIHLASGKSLRKFELPIPFTKKMAHCFSFSPDDETITGALRRGQILGLGGDQKLADAISASFLGGKFTNQEEFWITVIRWFILHPMLDRAYVGPILDFIAVQKFAANLGSEAVPAQPNLAMKDRSPDSVLNALTRWHGGLARINTTGGSWRNSGFQGFYFEEGSKNRQRIWMINELTTAAELNEEGRKMKHCVYTYLNSCKRGQCSIWSLKCVENSVATRALTIEVRNDSALISQTRGKCNRLPNEKEKDILNRWAINSGLRFPSYC